MLVHRNLRIHWGLALAVLLSSQVTAASPASIERESVVAVVLAFHHALASGDAERAVLLLAPDAKILEGGSLESRGEYVEHHLIEDIKFAKAVPSRSGPLDVAINGDVAWVSSTSESKGTYDNKSISLTSAELVVLTRSSTGWLIRAIHWSSRKAK